MGASLQVILEAGRVPHMLGAQMTVEHVVGDIRVWRILTLYILDSILFNFLSVTEFYVFLYLILNFSTKERRKINKND
jgi:hypothetical protein